MGSNTKAMNRKGALGCMLTVSLLVGLIMVGMFAAKGKENPLAKAKTSGASTNYDWEMKTVDTTKIREYLVELSRRPHIAASKRDEELVDYIMDQWKLAGIDSVTKRSYKMLLDYPDDKNPNLIKIYNAADEVVFTSHVKEKEVEDDPDFVIAFNAYSKSGKAQGVPVYANYGTVDDFKTLKQHVDITGKICLVRYGIIFRGNKAENGAKYGCAALIIFSDPDQAAANGTDAADVYPNSLWIGGTGVQRGSLSTIDGDPETPNWPSVENAYRLDEEDLQKVLPKIPVQPIGYTDAKEILSRMGGEVAPKEWQGGIANLVYRMGGKFNSENIGSKVEVNVNNKQQEKDNANVIGVIYGKEEPDRYVMLGNHRDAWGFGAVDPSSGTAQLIEVVRVLGLKLKSGWRPKRSIMFLSWGAEEYSLCGSREFVEEFQVQLEDRAVVYINTDVCMSGEILEAGASPTIAHLFKPATQDVWSPDGDGSYYDYWKRQEKIPADQEFEPDILMSPGAGSDHASFIYLAGVPVADIMFNKELNISGYPAYHTGYETFKLVEDIYDPDFVMFRACAQLNIRLGLEIADSEILPWKFDAYADVLETAVQDLEKNGVFGELANLGIESEYLKSAVKRFRPAVDKYKEHVETIDLTNPITRRTLNDQIRGFEKTFLLNPGLPNRLQYRHAIIAPSMFDAYGGSAFPGLGDLLFGLDELDQENRALRIKQLKRHISDLMIVIDRAAKYLRPLHVL